MGILVERTVWKKPRPANATRRSSDLTPEEHANVRAALHFLRLRLGTIPKLAAALNAYFETVRLAMKVRGPPSAGLALRTARLAGGRAERGVAEGWKLPDVRAKLAPSALQHRLARPPRHRDACSLGGGVDLRPLLLGELQREDGRPRRPFREGRPPHTRPFLPRAHGSVRAAMTATCFS